MLNWYPTETDCAAYRIEAEDWEFRIDCVDGHVFLEDTANDTEYEHVDIGSAKNHAEHLATLAGINNGHDDTPRATCPECWGVGELAPMVTCPTCKGHGEV